VQTLHLTSSAPAGSGCIVLLPAAHQRLDDFIQAGFGVAAQQRRLPLGLVLAAPPLAHLTDRAWLARLRDEIIQPQRAHERTLWLGGISLGAFMALRFAAEYPALIDGLCLLAPYLGSRIVAAEIERCASLRCWQPGVLSADDDERHVWRYLRDLRPPLPHVFVGLGRDDRFGDTQRLLARALPATSLDEIEGRHEWPVWRQLWDNFLDRYLRGEFAADRTES
jgi:pimeloyl-ACP methyl ester carboxylesterase